MKVFTVLRPPHYEPEGYRTEGADCAAHLGDALRGPGKEQKGTASGACGVGEARPSGPDDPELDGLVKTLFSAAAEAGVQLSSIGSPAPADFGLPVAAEGLLR